jgi:hypothetical protein
VTQRVTQQTDSHEDPPLLPLELAVRVCDKRQHETKNRRYLRNRGLRDLW